MKFKKLVFGSVLISSLLLCSCNSYGSVNDNQINVINDTREIRYKGDRIDSIKEYDNVKGFCWIDDNNIIIGKMNTKPLNHVQGLLETEKNKDKINLYNNLLRCYKYYAYSLYILNVDTNEERLISDADSCQYYPYISNNKKLIAYVNATYKNNEGEKLYISDLNGNVKLKIDSKYQFVSWLDSNNILIKNYENEKMKYYKIDLNGNKKLLDDFEITDDYVTAKDNKIYYKEFNRFEDNVGNYFDLKVYNINTNSTKTLKKDIVSYRLLNNKDIILERRSKIFNCNEFVLTKIDAKNEYKLTDGIFSYSLDYANNNIFYTLRKSNGESGFYMMNLDDQKEICISNKIFGSEIIISPSSDKFMVDTTKSDEKSFAYDVLNIYKLNK